MYLFDNPVLQRELLVNLRMKRAFVLLLFYQAALGLVVIIAWPRQTRLMANAQEAGELVNLFFAGQYLLASLMAPSFAALAITGEKERKTYELLLATPLKPGAITLGKLLAALTHLALLVFSSLPIVMLCLPLGGVSPYEVLAAYLGLMVSVVAFGIISLACSSYFERSASALAASYLMVLPLALAGLFVWVSFSGPLRLTIIVFVMPVIALAICVPLLINTSQRLLYPPDVGSEGEDVVDLDREGIEAVGLVINREDFPDRLFAPPKRQDLMADGTNPVYDKEIHSEIFGQGTLMLRLVVQVSMLLAIPMIPFTLFFQPWRAPWYISYVLLFNMLVGPVFSAGTITGERERRTLDLLLTTTITPSQILWGKLLAGLRVSSVLTMLLLWPVVLALAMVPYFRSHFVSMLALTLVVLLTCLTTSVVALFCSVLFRRTSMALMTSYFVLVTVFCLPVAASILAQRYLAADNPAAVTATRWVGVLSPFVAAHSLPMEPDEYAQRMEMRQTPRVFRPSAVHFLTYVAATLGWNAALLGSMVWQFQRRWRVAQ